ncbi:MAG: ribosome-associated translation inhibitor RaiA [Nitriliruptorales bacterium]|nr:ribosome-associated translation inhibitor RaiA [Nitriliruptorales bacterium]
MQIRVTGKNYEVPDHLKEQARAKLAKVTKLFDQFLDIEVVLSEESNPRIQDKYHCEVTLQAKGKTLRASAAAPDALSAIDRAQSKAQRQARKLKNKLVKRSRRPKPEPSFAVPSSDEE